MTTKKMHKHRFSPNESWKNALKPYLKHLKKTNAKLTDNLEITNIPSFAVIIVNKIDADNNQNDILSTIEDWLNIQSKKTIGWQFTDVDEIDNNNDGTNKKNMFFKQKLASAHIDAISDRVTNVLVNRYVLFPSTQELLTCVDTEELLAIASNLNKQLSQHLTKSLTLHQSDFDCHILPISHLLRAHKMACFDMDSTLIEQEVIVELAKATGIGNRVNEITESAMRGDINFTESFAKRLQLLHGTDAEILDDVNNSLVLSAGAQTTLCILNCLGYHTVLISGGFTFFANIIADKLNITEFYANELLIDDGRVIGEVIPPVVDGARKAELVTIIAKREGIEMSEVICIGDGANDLAMMAEADLGFAYHAKPIVQEKANLAINCTGLEGVLYGLGYGAILADFSSTLNKAL